MNRLLSLLEGGGGGIGCRRCVSCLPEFSPDSTGGFPHCRPLLDQPARPDLCPPGVGEGSQALTMEVGCHQFAGFCRRVWLADFCGIIIIHTVMTFLGVCQKIFLLSKSDVMYLHSLIVYATEWFVCHNHMTHQPWPSAPPAPPWLRSPCPEQQRGSR